MNRIQWLLLFFKSHWNEHKIAIIEIIIVKKKMYNGLKKYSNRILNNWKNSDYSNIEIHKKSNYYTRLHLQITRIAIFIPAQIKSLIKKKKKKSYPTFFLNIIIIHPNIINRLYNAALGFTSKI